MENSDSEANRYVKEDLKLLQDSDKDDEVVESRDTTLHGVYYTVEDVVERMGFGWYQLAITLFSGSLWVVEAFEMMIVTILSAAVKCQWNLKPYQEALITTIVFFGIMLGAPSWGLMADKCGRKKAMFAVNVLISVFGVASAFSPNYYVLLLLRGIVGFGIGGGILGTAYCTEFIPVKWRAVVLFILEFCWVLGTMFEAVLALVVMTNIHKYNWNWLLGLSAVPIIISTFIVPFVPESPRYLVYKGRHEKAAAILAWAARINKTSLPEGKLVTLEEKEYQMQLSQERQSILPEATADRDEMVENESVVTSDVAMEMAVRYRKEVADSCHSYNRVDEVSLQENYSVGETIEMVAIASDSDKAVLLQSQLNHHKKLNGNVIRKKLIQYYHWLLILFRHGWWKTTLLLWLLWFSANLLYYGGTLMITVLFQYNKHCGLVENTTNTTSCEMLDRSDYEHIVWTAAAEFPGIVVITGLLIVLGRKKSMAINTATLATFYGLLYLCAGKVWLTIFLAGIRGFAAGLFMSVYLYTPEVYPTAIRAFGMALCSAMSRIGGMTAPFIAQTIAPCNENIAIGLCMGLGVIATVACLLLPVETKGRALRDSGG